jgi:ABC-type bacteriocin/lantibiotic exporter with double-glycine peptidase domain
MKKIKVVYQNEHSECGIAAVTSVLNFFQFKITINDLRDKYGSPKGGLTFENMCAIMEKFGLVYHGVKVKDIDYLKKQKKPAILFWDHNHFVVFHKYRNGRYYVMDPKIGKVVYTKKEFESHFSLYALVFKEIKFKEETRKIRKNLKNKTKDLILSLLNSTKLTIISIIFVIFLSKVLSLIVPIMTQNIIDNYQSLASLSFLTLTWLTILIAGTYYLITVSHGLLLTKLQIKWNRNLSTKFMENIFIKSLNFFVNRSSGTMIYKANLITMIQQILSKNTIENIIDYLFMVVYFIFLANYSKKLTIITFFFCVLVMVISMLYSNINYKINGRVMEYQGEIQSIYVEIFSGMETIKSLGKERFFFTRWSKIFSNSLKSLTDQGKTAAWLSGISATLLFILPIGVLFLGIQEVQAHQMSLGQLIGFTTLIAYFVEPFSMLMGSVSQILVLKSYLNQISDVTNTDLYNESDGLSKLEKFESLKLRSVDFSFSAFEKNVISDLNLEIKKGEKVAIVGKSGSGKSTLLKLLCKLYTPSSGEIIYNGEEINNFDKDSLRKKIGYVTQSSIVFGNTIEENLMIEDESSDLVKEVLVATGIDEIVNNNVFGLNTIISENGMNLSGGQKQKISIARCLLKNPDLIIMDEPTSSLDNISEKKIMNYILNSGKTCVIVAHRLNTIKNMDRIIVLENGRIVEEGNHKELLKMKKIYYSLYNEI